MLIIEFAIAGPTLAHGTMTAVDTSELLPAALVWTATAYGTLGTSILKAMLSCRRDPIYGTHSLMIAVP